MHLILQKDMYHIFKEDEQALVHIQWSQFNMARGIIVF